MRTTTKGRSSRVGRSAQTNRVLVTGAAGFVGFHMIRRLLADGVAVHGIDNLNPYYDVGLKHARLSILRESGGFSFEKYDLADAEAVLASFRRFKPHAIIHLAAQAGVRYSIENPRTYVSSNLSGFLSVLEACRHFPVEHLIYASSSSVYGASTNVPFRESDRADHPVSFYAATKRANELMAHTYAHLYRIPSTGLRFFTVYGPFGRPDMAYFTFTRSILEGTPIDLYNGGQMERDFTYIDDVVEAIARLVPRAAKPNPNFDPANPDAASAANAPHRIYNIGNHTPVPLARLISAIETSVGRRARLRLVPMQPGDVPRTFADVSALMEDIGFSPSTQLEDGIDRFVAWYREYYDVFSHDPAPSIVTMAS